MKTIANRRLARLLRPVLAFTIFAGTAAVGLTAARVLEHVATLPETHVSATQPAPAHHASWTSCSPSAAPMPACAFQK